MIMMRELRRELNVDNVGISQTLCQRDHTKAHTRTEKPTNACLSGPTESLQV